MANEIRVRAGRKSRRKGSSNERALAKLFQNYWGHGEWARTPLSGGWATASTREAFRTCGDIITTATDFPFCLEGKKCEGWTLDQLLHNEKCIIFEWWKQVTDETPEGLTPLLVMARNHIPHAVMFYSDSVQFSLYKSFPHFVFHGAFTLLSLDNFFKINPDNFRRKLNMPVQDDTNPGRPKPSDRPAVAEPKIPNCDKCGQPLTGCKCTHNDLRK